MAAKVQNSIQVPAAIGNDPAGLSQWVNYLSQSINRFIAILATRVNISLQEDGSERMTAPLPLVAFTAATRPAAASWTGSIIYVSDGGAGAVFQGSNGAAWVNLG